jgi:hypothetical protein
MTVALERELDVFHRELPRLLQNKENRGKYVLIHGDDVEGVYPSMDDALSAGYERFGLDVFLVKLIADDEEPQFFARNVTRCR